MMIIDFLACVPLMITAETILYLYPLKLFRVFKLTRISEFLKIL